MAIAMIVGYKLLNKPQPVETECTISAAGVTPIATGLSHGDSSKEIISALSGLASSAACKSAVKVFVTSPETPVKINVALPSGSTTSGTITGSVLQPTEQSPPDSISRIIACHREFPNSQFLQDICASTSS